jgi:hypothetical protein
MPSVPDVNGPEQGQQQPAADNADTAASSARTSTGPALAVDLPQVAAAACESRQYDAGMPALQAQTDDSVLEQLATQQQQMHQLCTAFGGLPLATALPVSPEPSLFRIAQLSM